MWGWTREAAWAALGLAALGLSLALPAGPGALTSAKALTNCTGGDPALDSEEAAFLGLLNSYRAQNGLSALTTSANLMRSASWMAQDMGVRAYFAHTDSLGRPTSQRARDCGYPADAGENIAGGTNWQTAQDAFTAWRTSPGHNENMLNAPYRKIGIARAYVPGSQYSWYWVTDFGFFDDGTTADLPYLGPEYGVRASELTPGRWNVARVLPAGLRVSDLDGWTAWDQMPNGNWQEWAPSDYIPGGSNLGLMPVGMSMDRGRTPR